MVAISKSERELLKAIYRLSHGTNQAEDHTGDLADKLGLSPSTVTTAIKRLADRELLHHVPYRGVELTGTGRRVAVACSTEARRVGKEGDRQVRHSGAPGYLKK